MEMYGNILCYYNLYLEVPIDFFFQNILCSNKCIFFRFFLLVSTALYKNSDQSGQGQEKNLDQIMC